MPFHYFALGTSLANMANIEVTLANEPPPHVLEGRRIPLLGPVARRTLANTIQRNGSVDMPVVWDVMRLASLNTLVSTYFSNWTTASAALFASWLAEDGYYYPFSVNLERPYEGVHYRVVDPVNIRDLQIPGYGWTLQTNTENSTASIVASERYTESNTTGAAVTLTLPAANGVTANTVYSFKKTGGSNTLTVQRAGSDTLNGGSSVVVTTRLDIVSDGVSAWVSI